MTDKAFIKMHALITNKIYKAKEAKLLDEVTMGRVA